MTVEICILHDYDVLEMGTVSAETANRTLEISTIALLVSPHIFISKAFINLISVNDELNK